MQRIAYLDRILVDRDVMEKISLNSANVATPKRLNLGR